MRSLFSNLAIVENKHEIVIILINTERLNRKNPLMLQFHVKGFFGLQVKQINDISLNLQ